MNTLTEIEIGLLVNAVVTRCVFDDIAIDSMSDLVEDVRFIVNTSGDIYAEDVADIIDRVVARI